MLNTTFANIFRTGSRTYYYSSLFFPRDARDDVFVLYAFVRIADNFVDQIPQDKAGFEQFCRRYYAALKGTLANDEVIDSFVSLQHRRQFRQEWVDAFLRAMKSDLSHRPYRRLADLETYMHGSAEVIGLMMSQVMELPKSAHAGAQLLGKAMQYINFLRDMAEDAELGRTYIPQQVLREYKLDILTADAVALHPDRFTALMKGEVARYLQWVAKARESFMALPLRYRIPIATATDMYSWTAQQLEADPMIVWRRKVKPSIPQVVGAALRNTVKYLFG